LPAFVKFLESIDMLTSIKELESAIEEKSHASILYSKKPVLRIDLKGVYSKLDMEAIMTSRKVEINSIPIAISSPENHKLKFGSGAAFVLSLKKPLTLFMRLFSFENPKDSFLNTNKLKVIVPKNDDNDRG